MASGLTLADGQVAASATDIFDGSANTPGRKISITFHNTGAQSETVLALVSRAGGTQRRVCRAVLAQNECLVLNNLSVDSGDSLYAQTTHASVVDYLVQGGSDGPFSHYTLDANGAQKQTNGTTVTGATTLTTTSANGLAVGRQGATAPVFQVDASTSSVATGVSIKGAAAAAGCAVSCITSGTNENLTIDAAGSGTITFQSVATGSVLFAQSALVNVAGKGLGYGTGAGGAVTQITNRATGVTLSKATGQITTNNASLAAAAFADFIVTNTVVAATDVVVVNIVPGGTGSPRASVVNVGSGSFTIRVTNDHASTADTSADVINFVVLKGVAA